MRIFKLMTSAIAAACLSATAAAGTFTWQPEASGSITNPENWVPTAGATPGIPGAGDTGIISNSSPSGASLTLEVPAGSFGAMSHQNAWVPGNVTFDVQDSASFSGLLVAGSWQTLTRIHNYGSGNVQLSITDTGPVSIGNFSTYGQLELNGLGAGQMLLSMEGSLWVNGAQSAVHVLGNSRITAQDLLLGAGNSGFNATFDMQGSAASASFGNVAVGNTAGSIGTLQLADKSGLETRGNLRVGGAGQGLLQVTGGAHVDVAGDATIGDASTSYGSLAVVSGADSTFKQQGQLVVGNQGHGSMGISNGALVSTEGNAYVGVFNPTADVSVASGGHWDIGGSLYNGYGFSGRGILTVGAGSSVTAGTVVNSGAGSQLRVEQGGVLTVRNSNAALYNQSVVQIDGVVQGTVWNQRSGYLSGNGQINGDLMLDNGSIVSPGTGVGTLNVAGNAVAWGGAYYAFQMVDAAGSAGQGWDLLKITGSFDLAADAANPFRLNLLTVTADEPVLNFDPAKDYHWQLASFESLSGFAGNAFSVDSTGFGSIFTGSFDVSADSHSLYLNYITAVPEPESYAMLLAGLGMLGAISRRRKVRR